MIFLEIQKITAKVSQQVGKESQDNLFEPRYKLHSTYIIQHRIKKYLFKKFLSEGLYH